MQFSCQDAFANVYAEIFTRVIHQNNVAAAQFSKHDMLYGEFFSPFFLKIVSDDLVAQNGAYRCHSVIL